MMDAIPWRRRGRRCSSSRWRLPFSFLTLVPCLPTVPISRSLRALIGDTQARASSLSLSVSRRNNPCAESSVLRGGSVSQRRTTRFPSSSFSSPREEETNEERNEKCWREEKRRERKRRRERFPSFRRGTIEMVIRRHTLFAKTERSIDRCASSLSLFPFPPRFRPPIPLYSTINRRLPFLGRRERSTVNRGGHSRTVGKCLLPIPSYFFLFFYPPRECLPFVITRSLFD